MVGEHFDFVERPTDASPGRADAGIQRLFLGVQFSCCRVYARVYINHDGTQYVGHCPRCARRVTFKVGPGGTDERFFTAY
jgi:hypothetical protein